MLKLSFNILSLTFFKVLPIVVVLRNHLHNTEQGWNVQLVGWFIIVLILYFAWFKPMERKVKVWEIQDVNKLFVYNFQKLRVVMLFGMLWWLWIVLHQDYELIKETLFLVFLSVSIGWCFGFLGVTTNKKEVSN